MQKNNELELPSSTKWWQAGLIMLLLQLIRPSSIVIVILVVVYFQNQEFFNANAKDPNWIIDAISKFTNKASSSASVSIDYLGGEQYLVHLKTQSKHVGTTMRIIKILTPILYYGKNLQKRVCILKSE